MPRDSNGTYTLPPTNPVVDGTLIETVWANGTLNDIAAQLNNVLTRDGLLGPTGPFLIVDGTAALPGLAFATQPGTGLWRNSTQAGFSFAGVASVVWDANKVTFNKPLYLPAAAPTDANQATNKAYVDAAVAGGVGAYLPLAGGTLTGSLSLEGDWLSVQFRNTAGQRIATLYGTPSSGGFQLLANTLDDNGPVLRGQSDGLLVWGGNLGMKAKSYQVGDNGSLIYDGGGGGDIGFRHDTDGPYWTMRSDGTFQVSNGGINASGVIRPAATTNPDFYLGAIDAATTEVHFGANCYMIGGNDRGLELFPGNTWVALNGNLEVRGKVIKALNGSNECTLNLGPSGMYLYGNTSGYGIYGGSAGPGHFQFYTGGDFVTNGNITAYSDARLKTDIRPRTINLDIAAQELNIYNYKRIDTEVESFGGIAQELQQVLPECVRDNDGTLSMDYGRAAYALVVSMLKERIYGNAR